MDNENNKVSYFIVLLGRGIRYNMDADVFGTDDKGALYQWFIDTFDKVIASLVASGETFYLG